MTNEIYTPNREGQKRFRWSLFWFICISRILQPSAGRLGKLIIIELVDVRETKKIGNLRKLFGALPQTCWVTRDVMGAVERLRFCACFMKRNQRRTAPVSFAADFLRKFYTRLVF